METEYTDKQLREMPAFDLFKLQGEAIRGMNRVLVGRIAKAARYRLEERGLVKTNIGYIPQEMIDEGTEIGAISFEDGVVTPLGSETTNRRTKKVGGRLKDIVEKGIDTSKFQAWLDRLRDYESGESRKSYGQERAEEYYEAIGAMGSKTGNGKGFKQASLDDLIEL